MSDQELQARRERLEKLRAAGVDPFPARTGAHVRVAELRAAHDAKGAEQLDAEKPAAAIAGRVRAARSFGKLVFATRAGDARLVVMRGADVPTYVEYGAADIGITGKDVLMEQRERQVFELLDLGFGPCRMVVASPAGPDKAQEALRRLGIIRVATKYPRIASEYFEATGRQVEIVEVKGSVELAPLTGLVETIVDLTATGTTLRENGLVIREEIATSTARLISNRVAHRVRADAIDEIVEALRGRG